MRFTIIPDLYSDFDVFERGKLPARSYFIPTSTPIDPAKADFLTERYESDMTRVLSGEWDFTLYPDRAEMPAEIDTDLVSFDKVAVPSTWQRTGYQSPAYINTRYEFDNAPPELPENFPCGFYRKFVDIEDTDRIRIISFLGVAGGLTLYVNGEFVGYSEVAHVSAEFDLTPLLRPGRNEICALVYKYSTGTYLECQDMFREQGIFRDVLLFEYPKTYIRDFTFRTRMKDGRYDAELGFDIEGPRDGVRVFARILDPDKGYDSVVSGDCAAGGDLSFSAVAVRGEDEWNAEDPRYFLLQVCLADESGAFFSFCRPVGFRNVKIDGHVFLFNGKKIKFKGVNHHDTHFTKGYAMNGEDLMLDVRLMKELNVNAVRTSHYPPDPMLLDLATICGLYIVDEADIETHGMGDLGNIHGLSHDPAWQPRYVDRVRRMYERDKNCPCVTMWSLGNEAGGYCNQDACAEFLHSVCPEIPVHYEGVTGTERFHYDVISEMYTSIPELIKLSAGTRRRGDAIDPDYFAHPFFLCEYCHAMGVGPGGLEDYWKLFYSDDRFMGGCIWEWADHSVRYGDGKHMFTYGGDHGERKHDGHFCVDGLVYADRRLHTGAREMATVYRPLRAELLPGGVLRLFNTNRFASSRGIAVSVERRLNGDMTGYTVLQPYIAPESSGDFDISELLTGGDGLETLDVVYFGSGTARVREQIVVRDAFLHVKRKKDPDLMAVLKAMGSPPVDVSRDQRRNEYSTAVSGTILRYEDAACAPVGFSVADGECLVRSEDGAAPIRPNFWRAPIDNDSRPREKWESAGLPDLKLEPGKTTLEKLDDCVVFESSFAMVSDSASYPVRAKWAACYDGNIDADYEFLAPEGEADVPRAGIVMKIDPAFDTVEYIGRGPWENMPDFLVHAPIGRYTAKVADMSEPYVYPQDSGNHGDAKYIALSAADGRRIEIIARSWMSFSVRKCSDKALAEAGHIEDVPDENAIYLCLDGYVRGIGSSSCGPDTTDEYIRPLGETPHRLSFTMRFTGE